MTMRTAAGKVYRHLFPHALQARLDCARAAPAWREAGVIFVHTPKSAGISISNALYGRPLGHIYAADMVRYAPAEFASLLTFSIVRDPFDRYLSAIRFVKEKYSLIKGSPGLPTDLALLDDPRRLLEEWLRHQDLRRVNYVFRPQHYFLCADDSTVLPSYVGRFESLDRDMQEVADRLGKPVSLPRMNTTEKAGPEARDAALRAQVLAFYGRDTGLFGY